MTPPGQSDINRPAVEIDHAVLDACRCCEAEIPGSTLTRLCRGCFHALRIGPELEIACGIHELAP